MARHGHFWSLASLPLPLPRPLPENMSWKEQAWHGEKRLGYNADAAQGLYACGRGSLGLQGEGSVESGLRVNGARGDPANTAASTAGFSGARRWLEDGFRLARRDDFRSAKATACGRGSLAQRDATDSDPRRRRLAGLCGFEALDSTRQRGTDEGVRLRGCGWALVQVGWNPAAARRS
uniref:Uncharacterized protein n=1 Tax=Cucumis melo subsp. melo TaxID=412675 RepID=E5GBN2_CUCME|nr:hypothetical protein [Cucumis melo subsp. melo]